MQKGVAKNDREKNIVGVTPPWNPSLGRGSGTPFLIYFYLKKADACWGKKAREKGKDGFRGRGPDTSESTGKPGEPRGGDRASYGMRAVSLGKARVHGTPLPRKSGQGEKNLLGRASEGLFVIQKSQQKIQQPKVAGVGSPKGRGARASFPNQKATGRHAKRKRPRTSGGLGRNVHNPPGTRTIPLRIGGRVRWRKERGPRGRKGTSSIPCIGPPPCGQNRPGRKKSNFALTGPAREKETVD